jgi:hypothetical protein
MKDHLTALTEAVRLAQREIALYRDRGYRAMADSTIDRVELVLNSRTVNEAMAVFAPKGSPSIVPEISEGCSVKH